MLRRSGQAYASRGNFRWDEHPGLDALIASNLQRRVFVYGDSAHAHARRPPETPPYWHMGCARARSHGRCALIRSHGMVRLESLAWCALIRSHGVP